MLELLRGITEPTILVAHNAKFELGWLNRIGIPTRWLLPWDTMIAEYVLAGNLLVPLDLNSCAKRYGLGSKGRLVDRLLKGGVCPSEMPSHLVRERVESDVRMTTRLFYAQRARLSSQGLTRVLFSRCIVTPVLAAMEAEGMRLDPARVAVEYERLLRKRAELAVQLGALSGGRNLRSGPQMADLVYTVLGFEELRGRNGQPIRTETGRPVTNSDTLRSLQAKTPEQRQFVKLRSEYGKVDAALTKNVEFFYKVVEEQGSTFRATFNQCRTRTHRLSSSGRRLTFSDGSTRGVQFQNLPREYKRLFVARPGHVIAEADGAQLEFRVGGSLSRDPQILADVQTGADVHRFTAATMLRIPESEVTKRQRDAAKADTFKPMYGGQSGTLRQKEYYAAFRQKYATLFQTQTGWTMDVLRDRRLRVASGLIFHWPYVRMSRDGYVTETPSIFNYPVQSLATAEIIPVALTYLWWLASAAIPSVRFVNTVHDSVVAEVPEKDLDKYKELVVECFLNRCYEYMDKVYGIDLYVPLGVSVRAGTHWGDGEEVTTSCPYNGGKSSAS